MGALASLSERRNRKMQTQKAPYPVWTQEQCRARIDKLTGEVDAARGFGEPGEADTVIANFWKRVTDWVKGQREVYKYDKAGDDAVALCMLNMLDAFEEQFETQENNANETDIFSGLDDTGDLFACLDTGAA